MKKKGLSLDSTNHYDQWVGIDTLNSKNPTPVALRAVYKNRAAALTNDLGLVAGVAKRANADISGITGEKEDTKKTAAEMWGVITSNAFAFAEEKGMKDLKKSVSQLEKDRRKTIEELHDQEKTDNHDERLARIEKLAQLEAIETELEDKNAVLYGAKLYPR